MHGCTIAAATVPTLRQLEGASPGKLASTYAVVLCRTGDLGGRASTSDFTKAIIDKL